VFRSGCRVVRVAIGCYSFVNGCVEVAIECLDVVIENISLPIFQTWNKSNR